MEWELHSSQFFYLGLFHLDVVVVQSLSRVQPFPTLWTVAHQASLSITNSQNLFKLMSLESVMPSSHLILCRPLLLLPSIFHSIRVFSLSKMPLSFHHVFSQLKSSFHF